MIDPVTDSQVEQCLTLLKKLFGKSLVGVYLYGSSILGGLQKYSDVDLLVVLDSPLANESKASLVNELLKISGRYMKEIKRPLEVTIITHQAINPWQYPPQFEFQYGEWLRDNFEQGEFNPWSLMTMPDLAIILTQVLLISKRLYGANVKEIIPKIPYRDVIHAMTKELNVLYDDIESDTRNVLLTLTRIWMTIETHQISSKPSAARWALERLPPDYQPVISRARSICLGEYDENWSSIAEKIKPCAKWIIDKINNSVLTLNDGATEYTIK